MRTKVIVRSSRPHLVQEDGLSRAISKLFSERAMRRPGFSGCWASTSMPMGHRVVETYEAAGAKVVIASAGEGSELLYHVVPWEYSLPDDWVAAVNRAILRISFLPPPTLAASPEELRSHVHASSARQFHSMVADKRIDLGKGVEERETTILLLSDIVSRYTVGLGMFEVLMADDRIEDIYVDAPCRENPLHVTVNGIHGANAVRRCITNITSPRRMRSASSHRDCDNTVAGRSRRPSRSWRPMWKAMIPGPRSLALPCPRPAPQ